MGNEISVYKQLTSSTSECLEVIKREIGMKTSCGPFAVKLIEAMKTLSVKTEQETLDAANTLLSGLQTLMQGGILAEDYDKIDFVKRGKTIVPSARVEAFLRAAARKGYRITDTIIAVPKEDYESTYFEEHFYNGDIVYVLKDNRINPDRAVTAQRLHERYFSKFICRLEVQEAKTNKRIVMSVCEIPIEEMLTIAAASEQGIYKSKWEEYETRYGTKKRKVISDELNTDTFWVKWTSEMVNKTIIRRALKRVKEVLPELTESIYAFEQDEYIESEEQNEKEEIIIDVDMDAEKVDLDNLTSEQKKDCTELYDMWAANPKLAEDAITEIKQMFEGGKTAQEVVNERYAEVYLLRKSKKKWPEIRGLFDA